MGILLRILALSALVSAPSGARAEEYFNYANARYNFRVSYSSDLFREGRESENADGITATSKDGVATMLAYGSYAPGTLGLTLEQIYRQERDSRNRQVTYKKFSKSKKFFVLSGYEDGQIFYMKSYVLGEVQLVLMIYYAKEFRSPYDRAVSEISKSFVPSY